MELIMMILMFYGIYALYRKFSGKDKKEVEKILTEANEQSKKIIEEANTQSQKIVAQANADAQKINDATIQNKEELKSIKADLKELKKEYNILGQDTLVAASNIEDLDALGNITSEECKNKLVLLKQKEKEVISSDQGLNVTSVDSKKVVLNNQKQILM